MKISLKSTAMVMLLCSLGSAGALLAQDDGTNGPPKVLFIVREVLKPGKGGSAHEKTEGAYAAALAAAKAPVHYLGMTSISGPDRALFFSGYPSFAAMEEEHKAMGKIAGLGAKLDTINMADGDLLSESVESIWTRNDEQSYNAGNLKGKRYMDISQYNIKPGHEHDWDELVKLVKAAYKKSQPDVSWSMYEMAYGNVGRSYLVLWPLASMADVDHIFAADKDFAAALGSDGQKKLAELEAASIESSTENLFAFSPKMSAPPQMWIDAEPDYWKAPKPMMAKKPEAKPAQ